MIRINIDLTPARRSLYEKALTRIRGAFIASESEADALIVGDCKKAMQARAPCLLDHPEAIPLAQLKALASSQVRLMPAHVWRFLPSIIPIHQGHAAGHLGEPGLLRVHLWHHESLPLQSLSFGQIDLAHWFFGATPNHVHSLSRPDYLQWHLGFPNDGMAIIDVAACRPSPHPYYSMHLIGSDGAAYADDHHNAHLLFDRKGSHALLHARNEILGIRNLLDEFVNGIVENRAWSVGVPDSVKAKTIVEEQRV